ncbi:TPA: transglycosylase SLT domain-containing protein [Aeromonas hydrophila]|nr:transglycosylase SLT domain-containing protein [Aeromonas hydrophila]HAT2496805.1 transglycosylase SLT domain-containing protein [Aeromonas hydrophila]HAT2512567.1 transglycosylase SLT domain-containing protein [Aeromonas hydrophila]HAT2533012.1 transglycosylase SLT domain-containing protein [Aeromonas hydrophila]
MKKMLAVLLALSHNVSAADCFDLAGQAYRIDSDLLRSISFRESSFNPRALNVVSETKYAVGLMQIHSNNFPHLAQFGITPTVLYNDPCMNIYTGAYYLAIAIKRLGYNWEAVGAFYAGFEKSPEQAAKRKWYADRVRETYEQIKNKKGPITGAKGQQGKLN